MLLLNKVCVRAVCFGVLVLALVSCLLAKITRAGKIPDGRDTLLIHGER